MKSKLYLVLIFIISFWIQPLFAQDTQKTDSLELMIAFSKSNLEKIDLLLHYSMN